MSNNKSLGRGLNALFGMYDQDESYDNITNQPEKANSKDTKTNGSVLEIEIDKVKPNPNQPRKKFDQEALEELASSIKIHGIVQPIVVNKLSNDEYMIIAGERRWRAGKLCGLKTVPAIVKNYTEKQIKEISIIENLQREDLNPIEAGRAIKQLMDEYGLTQEVVSERIGKSRSNVANTLRLLSLCPEVISMVESGKLSAGHARCLVVVDEAREQIRLANMAVDKNMNVRELEKAVKNYIDPPKRIVQPQEQSLELRELINQMQKTFATKVSAVGNDNKGRIYIDYYSRDDLDRLSEILEIVHKKELTLQDLQNYNNRNKK